MTNYEYLTKLDESKELQMLYRRGFIGSKLMDYLTIYRYFLEYGNEQTLVEFDLNKKKLYRIKKFMQ